MLVYFIITRNMEEKRFQKRTENFVCENCGQKVIGSGYTDHCLSCLFSKHVDINPGDRKAGCKGTMEPVGAESKSGEYIIHYLCRRCKHKHQVTSSPDDNFEEILKLSFTFSPWRA
jgi:hypothetical protein